MEKIKVDRVDSVRSSLERAQKVNVAAQLERSFAELRQLPSPGGYCSTGRVPLRDYLFYIGPAEKSQHLEGPFETQSEFNDALVRKYLASGEVPVVKANPYRRSFSAVLEGPPLTLRHGDLQGKNIFVWRQDLKISMIDWEVAGWYPSYWEYARALLA